MDKFKVINGFDDKYIITFSGKIYRIDQYGEFILCRPTRQKTGHLRICLNRTKFLVHRLVAEFFIPNPNNYPMVNHIDSNPSNNNVNNLEWCDASHNQLHSFKTTNRKSGRLGTVGSMNGRFGDNHPQSKKIKCLNNNKIYNSIRELGNDIGIDTRRISEVLNGKRDNINGFSFELI